MENETDMKNINTYSNLEQMKYIDFDIAKFSKFL